MITATTSLPDLAGAVTAALRGIGCDPVVVGGSASTLHVPEAYRSDDVDFVILGGVDAPRILVEAMKAVGFSQHAGTFVHSENPCTVDFVPSPVAIGDDVLGDFVEVETAFGPVRTLSPTDAVCDRLNKYIVWSDSDSLTVALAVARARPIDLARIEAFVARHAVGVFRDTYQAGYARFLRDYLPPERTISPYSFTTALRLRFTAEQSEVAANETFGRIQSLLDEQRAQIGGLSAVALGGPPFTENDFVTLPLSVRTEREEPFVEKIRIALDLSDHLRRHLDGFPELQEVIDDDAPLIATTLG